MKARMREVTDKRTDTSTKEKNLLTVLESCSEMLERGCKFGMIDLYKSDTENFVTEGDTLVVPFRVVPNLGLNAVRVIVVAREEQLFLSKEDLATRGKAFKTSVEYMNENGVLKDPPNENQLPSFDML